MLSVSAFLLFFAGCTLLALTRYPIFGIYLYFAATYVHPPSRWWGSLVPDLRWSLLSAAIAALAVFIHWRRLGSRPNWLTNGPVIIMCAYVLWMLVQSQWAIDPQAHSEGTVQLSKYLIAMWLIYRIVVSTEDLRELLFAHMLGCALLGIYALTSGRVDERLDGVGGPGMNDANTLAMYFATGAIACGSLVLSQRGWRRWVCFPAMALILNGFILANTRGAFVALVAGGLVFMALKAREHARLFWVLALLSVPAMAALVDESFIGRMTTIVTTVDRDAEMDASARSRWELQSAQMRMFLDYPMGSGHRGVAALSPQYLERKWLTVTRGMGEESAARSSHNTVLTALSEQGVPGIFLFGALVLWIAFALLRINGLARQGHSAELQTLTAALGAGLVTVLVAGMFTDFLLAEVQYWYLMALCCAFRFEPAASAEPEADPAANDAGLDVPGRTEPF